MKSFKSLLAIGFTLFSLQLFAHGHHDPNENITPYNDALDALNGYKIQHLKDQPVWRAFVSKNANWGARFNRYTKLPHRALGSPIKFGSSNQDLMTKSIDFINTEFGEYEIPTQDLFLTRNYNDGKYIHIDFKQLHDGMEILWSNIKVRYAQNKDIVLFGFDAHTAVPKNLPVILTPQQAQQKAEDALVTPIVNSTVSTDKKVIPVPINGNYEYHVVYEVVTNTQDTKDMPGKYLSYVDAETGKIWYRDNDVKQIGFIVNADLYPTNLFNPSQVLELKHLRIVDNATTYYTDDMGSVTIPGPTFGGTIHLDGRYCDIVTTQGGVPSPSISPSSITNNGVFTFPMAPTAPQIQHFTTYYHVNEIHDFMKSKMPSFTAMDNPLTTRIDRTDGSCNAFYNGNSINFYTTSGGCNAFSLINTVIYHEYGHGISNQFYNSQGSNFSNGGLGEGYSDIWAMFLNDDPIVGQGRNIGNQNSLIRRYDVNPKVYPQDLVGQVHADGEIIAGAWWDTYQYWGSLDSVSALFGESLYGLANGPNGSEGEVYFDVLIDALQYDDTDNDITNGTPHFNFIVQGFADHGIYLLNNSEVIHNDLFNQNSGVAINVRADVKTDFTPFVGDLTLQYKLRGSTGAYTPLVMTRNSLQYDITFPSQTAGEVYEYYFELSDNMNSYAVPFPKNVSPTISFTERNIPYYVLIGFKPKYQELFDGSGAPAGWTVGNAPGDNAIRGIWSQGTPVPSFEDPNDSTTLCQTYYDHNGGGQCLFTGNAGSPTASIGQGDVDGGRTTVISPLIDISSYNTPVLGYSRWFSNSQGSNARKDWWTTYLSYNGGANWFPLERTYEPDVKWRRFVVRLAKTGNQQVMVRFVANDSAQAGAGGALVEAALDAFEIYDIGETATSTKNFDKLSFKVFPNPARESVNLLLPEEKEASYEILTSVGQVIKSQLIPGTSKQITIPTGDLASGMYYIRVYQDGKLNIKKLTIAE